MDDFYLSELSTVLLVVVQIVWIQQIDCHKLIGSVVDGNSYKFSDYDSLWSYD